MNVNEARKAGSIVAAEFLRKFTGGVPWAHLDIAGTAYEAGRPYAREGRQRVRRAAARRARGVARRRLTPLTAMTAIAAPSEEGEGSRTALMSIVAACVLVALKLGTGLATGSLALVSAGVESSGDVIAAVLTLIAVRFGSRPADREHPYGHRRAENLAALGESVIIAAAADARHERGDPAALRATNPHVVETSVVAVRRDRRRDRDRRRPHRRPRGGRRAATTARRSGRTS